MEINKGAVIGMGIINRLSDGSCPEDVHSDGF